MLLKWSGHQEEATGLADEGRRVFSQLLALEPDDVQGQGVWADFLLDLGQPDEALRVLEKVVGGQVKGDYLSSLLMAALAAGHPERVLAAQADIAASQDAQAHWLNVLALAQVGRVPEAVHELEAWQARSVETAVQWPRGIFDGLEARTTGPAAPALGHFVRAMEAGLATDDAEGPTKTAFDTLLDELRAVAAQSPESGRSAPPR